MWLKLSIFSKCMILRVSFSSRGVGISGKFKGGKMVTSLISCWLLMNDGSLNESPTIWQLSFAGNCEMPAGIVIRLDLEGHTSLACKARGELEIQELPTFTKEGE